MHCCVTEAWQMRFDEVLWCRTLVPTQVMLCCKLNDTHTITLTLKSIKLCVELIHFQFSVPFLFLSFSL